MVREALVKRVACALIGQSALGSEAVLRRSFYYSSKAVFLSLASPFSSFSERIQRELLFLLSLFLSAPLQKEVREILPPKQKSAANQDGG